MYGMETNFDTEVNALRQKVKKMYGVFEANHNVENLKITMPEEFKKEFLDLVDKVIFSLMEENENFYGYFLYQMSREIRYDISSPTAVNFKGTKYVIYFNPFIFLKLNIKQMESTIKHEILHVLSIHLIRAKGLRNNYSKLAINTAMDIVVNKYLDDLPPYATTLEWVNLNYGLKLPHHATFEYYAEKIQAAIDQKYKEMEVPQKKDIKSDSTQSNQKDDNDTIQTEYNIANTHDIWEESSNLDDETIKEFTEKVILSSEKGNVPAFIEELITDFKNNEDDLPWNLYLNQLMGTVESNKKKTITRRNRRQPERLDLRGELRSHKAKIVVAIDISGSISGEEFKQAMLEVIRIIKNYSHDITILECDDRIRREYKVRTEKDLKDRMNTKGNTKFSPVFEYANHNQVNLLIYFTDGKGEEKLRVTPQGYKILWVISGGGEELSVREPYGAVKRLRYRKAANEYSEFGEVERGGFSMNHQEGIL